MKKWQRVLADIDASGKSIAQYCREHRLKPHQVHYWRRKFRPLPQTTGFVQVHTAELESAVEIIYPNGVQLKLNRPCSLDKLKMLLDV